jgi:hypothetical protein
MRKGTRKINRVSDVLRLISFRGEGTRSRRYGRTAALRLLVQPCDEGDYFFSVLPCKGAPVEGN